MSKEFKAICIKSYIDEDDLREFERGEKELHDCKVYHKGTVYMVRAMYNKKYFKRIEKY